MSPDNGNFYKQLQSQYLQDRKPATLKQIKRSLTPNPVEADKTKTHIGHHNNKAESARKRTFELLKAESYMSWIKGIEYDPDRENGDIVINLEKDTPQGKFLIDLIG